MDAPRLPNRSQRLTVIGRTGTGKTVAGMYHVSRRNLKKEKWVLLNFKGDELIDSIERAQHIDYDWRPPRRNWLSRIFNRNGDDGGLFVLHPNPNDKKPLEEFLWRMWESGDVGIFADEGYMLTGSEAFEAILTQGRSLRIPVIACTQRPAWVSRFVFSEADFFQLFDLNDRRDWQTVESFMPRVDNVELQNYHSWYYDVARKQMFEFSPVPPPEEIRETIDAQLFSRKI